MKQYLELLQRVLDTGIKKEDRTGVGTISRFGDQIRVDLSEGFPLLTTKKVHLKSIIHELLWFLKGDTNVQYLQENGVRIWDHWHDEFGSIGPGYGKQWREWEQVELIPLETLSAPPVTLNPKLVAGVGKNTSSRTSSPWHTHMYAIWNEMLHRCYDKNRSHYHLYGGRGVFVDDSWFDFEVFLRDVKKLPNFLLKKEYPSEYELDKDYLGTNCYGPLTTLWLSKKEQRINTSRSKLVRVWKPGTERSFLTMNVSSLCDSYRLDRSTVYECIRGEKSSHKGWKFAQEELPEGVVPRLRIFDQIRQTVATIKHNSDCRRNIVNSWNVAQIEQMQLPPCHCHFQCYVANGKLSLHMYQRSADIFLGVPFNIASYALLTMMLAHVTGYEPGEYIHTFGDVHIYLNHIDQVKLQLSREPRPLPKMILNPKVKNIFDFKYEDFKLENYNPHPRIKAQVAV